MAKISKKPDLVLLGVVVTLLVLGIIILASTSASFSYKRFGNTYYFLQHQLLFGLLPGLILGYLAFRLDLARLKKWAPILLLATLVLMVMVFLPVIGSIDSQAARWIGLGPFSFQPSELLKLTFILYLASWLVSRQEKREAGFSQTLIAFLAVIGVIAALLFFQSNISTLGVIVFTGFLMYFFTKTPLWHSILIILMGAGGLFSLIKLASYRIDRLMVFLNPDFEPMGIGYQAKQALISVGSGGPGGVGLGLSTQKLGFLPQTISDCIFAVFSEETGFVGGVVLVLLFLLFLIKGFQTAKTNQDKFLQLTALGITCWIIIQSFVNIGAMFGLLPLTGIPLPFISYGGSALVIELIAMGILLNISRKTV